MNLLFALGYTFKKQCYAPYSVGRYQNIDSTGEEGGYSAQNELCRIEKSPTPPQLTAPMITRISAALSKLLKFSYPFCFLFILLQYLNFMLKCS